jgi:uncharacterized protein (TIGR02145 family)
MHRNFILTLILLIYLSFYLHINKISILNFRTPFFASIIACIILVCFTNCKKDEDKKADFIPLPPVNGVMDVDGNVYDTLTIGTQVWMKQNLRVEHYRNGDTIGTTSPATLDISGEDNPKYQWVYDGNTDFVPTYGRLYTWFTATDSRQICPTGWHVPNNTDWTKLMTYLGGINVAGGKMKDTGIVYWISTDTGATNESGFTALPGGSRGDNNIFDGMKYGGVWWSTTATNDHDAWAYCLYYYANYAGKGGFYMKSGFSVRCVRDN